MFYQDSESERSAAGINNKMTDGHSRLDIGLKL
jgi:hypothetical protein